MGASVSVLRAQMPGLDDNQERTMAVLLFDVAVGKRGGVRRGEDDAGHGAQLHRM
jgi:hypothetical protein